MMERINITIDIQTIDKLKKISKSMGRSTSGVIRQLVKEYNLDE